MGLESYVLVHNIAKRHNVGTLARSATAFGVSELILVGRRDFNSFGSHGSSNHLRFRHFHSLQDARNYLKDKDCDICGVEITHDALPVNHHPFKKSTAFLLGNEVSNFPTSFHFWTCIYVFSFSLKFVLCILGYGSFY